MGNTNVLESPIIHTINQMNCPRVSPILPHEQKTASFVHNYYNLSPAQTDHLNAFFNLYAGPDRRMTFSSFRKMFKHLNSHLSGRLLEEAAVKAFIDADTNKDRMISFDEFVNSYCNFKATKDLQSKHQIFGNQHNYHGIFYPLSFLDQNPNFKYIPSWRILNLLNQANIYYAHFNYQY